MAVKSCTLLQLSLWSWQNILLTQPVLRDNLDHAQCVILYVLSIIRSLCTVTQRDGVIYLSPMSFSQWWKFIKDLRYRRNHSICHNYQAMYTKKGYILRYFVLKSCIDCTHIKHIHKEKGFGTQVWIKI